MKYQAYWIRLTIDCTINPLLEDRTKYKSQIEAIRQMELGVQSVIFFGIRDNDNYSMQPNIN